MARWLLQLQTSHPCHCVQRERGGAAVLVSENTGPQAFQLAALRSPCSGLMPGNVQPCRGTEFATPRCLLGTQIILNQKSSWCPKDSGRKFDLPLIVLKKVDRASSPPPPPPPPGPTPAVWTGAWQHLSARVPVRVRHLSPGERLSSR